LYDLRKEGRVATIGRKKKKGVSKRLIEFLPWFRGGRVPFGKRPPLLRREKEREVSNYSP